ncbi:MULTISPECIES: amylo-alpha-1,6-glucosidase [unclassified Mesorhizobium]|uniref:amylo-alpha-1,6-glucosidase n=2 Tax=Mesorhizobium TaxID=68287 RepID=UPI000F753F73|nr:MULTISPECIES: amylo-alpha-1,6-glucosidase [unclassified Mesorhizobium]AZO22785.1 amylo-alpha-1,6-glucosidase [Mesorhizobium sp. M1E.F.Ca.ET.045.02.1.1]RUW78396.1 amylo-alpha-1,6-glucosidase [Mesorhizobium sp. M1E.F.Ca.ET.063.01.1.1]RWD87983.1 MAG: amylo-alpha-1,6-glucosidase [Mesorhizobium sp.]RWD94091.1 MAG: amylo-alpha-1,6-glucosidase [Mesorhizobium sp.]TIV50303.1 MAG: amylo-alpha-1,6-glucosidase [Mesorhizobium sp.]
MTQLDERKLDPAVALASLDETAPREPHRLFALKQGDCFAVTDAYGDIRGAGDGFFRDDTRVLSEFRLTVGGRQMSLLGASLSQDNVLFTSNLTNLPIQSAAGRDIPQGAIHIERVRLIWQDRLFDRITLSNYSREHSTIAVSLHFAADFRDMFEVRGSTRPKRGTVHVARTEKASVLLGYDGLDGLPRLSAISFSQAPDRLSDNRADFLIAVTKRSSKVLYVEVGPEIADTPGRDRFRAAAARARFGMRSKRRHGATVHSSGRVFNDWVERARADVALLTTELSTGPYPYAGIPWFSTAFGRDGVISGLQMLWLNPGLARGVLAFLAEHQATETSPFIDSQPGKIMHETRKGEMAALRELPFGRYYGGVDTTPLYIHLACAYADRTGDMAFVDTLWPSLKAAAEWTEEASRATGFVTYQRAAESGLANQGWKDSIDSVFHADGRIPKGPIALVEVQGYVFAAYRGLASLARRRGEFADAEHWENRAEEMRLAVERDFWMDDLNFYALAIDGEGEPCKVRTSNAGHLLYVGLPELERAKMVADQLLSASFHSGWGLRTLADDAIFFNPMSYHNGSIWPHDTALCGVGLARYGERDSVVRMMSGTFESAVHFNMRLPELFCGFTRAPGEAPIAYPVACLPQAWSAGSTFMLMQACLGLEIDGWEGELHVTRPRLPIGIDTLTLRHLSVGDKSVDLAFQRVGDRVVAFLSDRHEGMVPLIVRT